MTRPIIAGICLLAVCTFGQAQTKDELAAAHAANAFAAGQTTELAARAVVPGYTATPPETALRDTDLKGGAKARLATCAATGSDPSCEGQVHAASDAVRPRPQLSGEPALAAARQVARAPDTALGGLGQYYSGCTTAGACPTDAFCLGSQCYSTQYTNDADFARTMTYMEAVREAGVYLDPATQQVFGGEGSSCRNRLLKNCCYTNAAGANMSNQRVFTVGSRLVYDILMDGGNRDFLKAGMMALLKGNGFTGSFSSFGVTVAVNGTALPAGSVTLTTGDSYAVAVDPYTMAIMVVIYVISDLSSCNKTEAMAAMKEGAHLCHSIGEWCSSCVRVLGKCVSCIEKSIGKCCFNSRLARLVNEQGRGQLGKDWGDPEHPKCGGFTIAELQRLDFARMDLSEFYASIIPTLPNVGDLQAVNQGRAIKCYGGNGKCQ
ncbi:conjugal transfer protein TraN [Massilia sp. TS11]|uniref:conjugal transfer protein TraN n=1 Tax=Massilia sp. TS11 TaxID=2908003 RepID=UPI001EDB8A60|nr:conjugal transfer protein TraN [Massilia sp. TS11]MCG2583881.1 conjugal transfer protein TraN [Massilia sp. TS11]